MLFSHAHNSSQSEKARKNFAKQVAARACFQAHGSFLMDTLNFAPYAQHFQARIGLVQHEKKKKKKKKKKEEKRRSTQFSLLMLS